MARMLLRGVKHPAGLLAGAEHADDSISKISVMVISVLLTSHYLNSNMSAYKSSFTMGAMPTGTSAAEANISLL